MLQPEPERRPNIAAVMADPFMVAGGYLFPLLVLLQSFLVASMKVKILPL